MQSKGMFSSNCNLNKIALFIYLCVCMYVFIDLRVMGIGCASVWKNISLFYDLATIEF